MAKNETNETPKKWTMDELRGIVAAGMSVGEARLLLEEGYAPADVLELAQLQSTRKKQEAAEAQTATAKAMQKAMKPENETHPGVSAFSYPEGDVKHPKVTLPFQFFYNNYPFHKFPETQHWRELELASQVQPGSYTVLRKDTSKMVVTVTATKDADNKIEKLELSFPVLRDEKGLTPPQSVLLYQVVNSHKPPKRAFLEAMQEYLIQTLGVEDLVEA